MARVRQTYQRSCSGPCAAFASAVFIPAVPGDGSATASGVHTSAAAMITPLHHLEVVIVFIAVFLVMSAQPGSARGQARAVGETWRQCRRRWLVSRAVCDGSPESRRESPPGGDVSSFALMARMVLAGTSVGRSSDYLVLAAIVTADV